MMHAAQKQRDTISTKLQDDNRNKHTDFFTLVEIERAEVVDTIYLDDEHEADSIIVFGSMRELCPGCGDNHLKLVLRQKHVRQAHLFCECCDICFDARNADGVSVLEMDE